MTRQPESSSITRDTPADISHIDQNSHGMLAVWRTSRDWKLANISAIHKKDSKNDPYNYRPISLTAICCKILERIIKRHIINFLVQNHIISDQQFSFVPGSSTTLQLLRALEYWTAELDSGNEVDIIYIDFQKAFDSVPHKRLLRIIDFYGSQGKIHDWITAFLSGRKQRVLVNKNP